MDKETNNSQKIMEKLRRREENEAWVNLENTINRKPPKYVKEKKKKTNIFLSLTAFIP